MDNFKENIAETINQLELMSKVISAKLEAKPHISIFDSIASYNLDMFYVLPSPTEYTLTDFQPHNLGKESLETHQFYRDLITKRLHFLM